MPNQRLLNRRLQVAECDRADVSVRKRQITHFEPEAAGVPLRDPQHTSLKPTHEHAERQRRGIPIGEGPCAKLA